MSDVRDLAEELKLWRTGRRSHNNFIVGSVGDPEIEQRLIREADTAHIAALTAELNATLYRESSA